MFKSLFVAIMFIVSLMLTTAVTAEPKQTTAELKTVTLSVENMSCAMCPITVRKSLQRVSGVTQASADFNTKTATVTYDPATTNIKALTRATGNAGYPSSLKNINLDEE